MICLSKADEGTFRHLEYNQSPRPLGAETTTRQDLNGIANLREHVAAGQDGEGGCNGGSGGGSGSGGGGGGAGGMGEKMGHGGLPPGSPAPDAGRWPDKEPSSRLPTAVIAPHDRLPALGGLPLPSLSPSLRAAWSWASWLLSVLAVSVLLNYLNRGATDGTVRSDAASPSRPSGRLSARQLSRRDTCASGGVSSSEYNTSLHAGALVIIWTVSSLACAFPILARRLPGLRIPQRFFFVVRHFGTGVLIATAFVHLLPTAFISLGNPCLSDFWISDYPAIPGAIALAAIFLVSIIEMVFHPARRCTSMPSAGVVAHNCAAAAAPPTATSAPTTEKRAPGQTTEGGVQETSARDGATLTVPMRDMQPPRRRSGSMVHSLNRLNTIEASDDDEAAGRRPNVSALHKGTNNEEAVVDDDLELAPTQSPASSTPSLSPEQKLRKERLQCVLLELGILFHSIFIGMALAVSVGNEFVILLIAIVFHQTFEGLALGARIASIKWPQSNRRQPWLMALAYGCTTPLGQAIGIATHTLYSPDSEVGLVVVGVMNAISAGLLTFASLVELLSEDFLSDESWEYLRGRKRVVACVLVFLGAFCMSLVGAWA